MNKYVIVMSTDKHYLPGATAVINGLALYDNPVDIHILTTPDVPPAWTSGLPDNCTAVDWRELPVDQVAGDATRGLPWQVRFYRYWYACQISSHYQALMILDSDCFVVGNIMEAFTVADRTGELVVVQNDLGRPMNTPIDRIIKANEPPFHCHGATFKTNRYQRLLGQVYDEGLTSTSGDMVALYRAVVRSGYDLRNLQLLPNDLWCLNGWWGRAVQRGSDIKGRPVLQTGDPLAQQLVVHGKWWDQQVIDKELQKLRAGVEARANLELFKQMYDRLALAGPARLVN